MTPDSKADLGSTLAVIGVSAPMAVSAATAPSKQYQSLTTEQKKNDTPTSHAQADEDPDCGRADAAGQPQADRKPGRAEEQPHRGEAHQEPHRQAPAEPRGSAPDPDESGSSSEAGASGSADGSDSGDTGAATAGDAPAYPESSGGLSSTGC